MFPTTIWSTIKNAGMQDPDAMEDFARRYRPLLREFVMRGGYNQSDSDDICQEVFVRVLSRDVLSNAHPAKGKFRSLLLAVTRHVIGDHWRKKRHEPSNAVVPEFADQSSEFEDAFDRAWVMHLTFKALRRLEDDGSPYFSVLKDHLSGVPQDRNRVWIARRKLISIIRQEIMQTCTTHDEFLEEVAHLSQFLRPARK